MLFILLTFSVLSATKEGNMKLLAVSNPGEEYSRGTIATLHLEIEEGQGRVFMDSYPLSKIDTQISTRFAKEVACNFIEVDCNKYNFFYTIRSNSAVIGGPSAGAAISILTISVLEDLPIDESISITGTINTGGIIGPVGSILPKTKGAGLNGEITKVLIPKYTDINGTNLTEYEELYNIKVIEVSHLTDAVYEFTGKDYKNYDNLELSDSYADTMGQISNNMCDRAQGLALQVYKEDENITAINLLKRGKESLKLNAYYSAASFCFGSGLNARNKIIQEQNLNPNNIMLKINETYEQTVDYLEYIKSFSLKTLTDLETYMAVTDRIFESQERLQTSIEHLQNNNTNASIFELGYAIERFHSARTWAEFFGTKCKEFKFNKHSLDESCLKKISEVEERIQYIDLFLPSSTDGARESVTKAYQEYNSDNPEVCLYEASIAKARIDLLLNSMTLDPDYVDDVIEDRLGLVKSIIAKQNSKGIFPIVAYSYYEYADALKETDKYSSLLYLGYALELANMDIYFEKKEIEFPRFTTEQLLIFGFGFATGLIIVSLSFMLIEKRKKKVHFKHKKS